MGQGPEARTLSTVPGGPPPGAVLCAIDDIPDGGFRVFTFEDGGDHRLEMFIHRRGGAVFAYENRCPHAGHPLDWTPGVFLDPAGERLQCASHGARFRIEDGVCVAGPCPGRALTPVAIEVRGGMILAP